MSTAKTAVTTAMTTFGFLALLSAAAFAEDKTAPAAGEVPLAPRDCPAEFKALDRDGDGFLSPEEAPREYARSRIDAITLQETGLSEREFTALCSSDQWQATAPEAGAPFEGANSFTEEQARDRAIAWNVTELSALTQDGKGIWRGTGKVDDAMVDVAIDYRGNVVTTPQPDL